jgi:hypothetical protein
MFKVWISYFVPAHIWGACSIGAIHPLQLPEIVGFAAAIRNFRLRRSSLEWKSNIIEQKGRSSWYVQRRKML